MSSIREKQRFQHFEKALTLLSEIELINIDAAELIVLEGYIQRFEYTFELAWKFLKDVMEADGLVLDIISPKSVVRTAFESKYIANVNTWIAMANDRNKTSHVYDSKHFEDVIHKIKESYLPELKILFSKHGKSR